MYSERTLMISGSEKGLDSVTSFLKACGCGSVAVISSGSEARRMIPHDDFDLILINTPLKDEFGHQLAVKLCESTCSGVILICKADLAEEMTNCYRRSAWEVPFAIVCWGCKRKTTSFVPS